MGKPRTYSCWDASKKIQDASHWLGIFGSTYEVFPGGRWTRTGAAILLHMTPVIRTWNECLKSRL